MRAQMPVGKVWSSVGEISLLRVVSLAFGVISTACASSTQETAVTDAPTNEATDASTWHLDADVVPEASVPEQSSEREAAANPTDAGTSAGRGDTAETGAKESSTATPNEAGALESNTLESNEDAGLTETTCGSATDLLSEVELAQFEGCQRFRGSVYFRGNTACVAPFDDLQHIEGSLYTVSDLPEPLFPALREVDGRLVLTGPATFPAIERVGVLGLFGLFSGFPELPALRAVTERVEVRVRDKGFTDWATALVEGLDEVGDVDISLSVPPDAASENEVVCGAPEDHVRMPQPSLLGCTRFRGSIALSDIQNGSNLDELKTLQRIDGSLSLFRPATTDFTALSNLRSVGDELSFGSIVKKVDGLENLNDVGRLTIDSSILDVQHVPRRVREFAFIRVGDDPSALPEELAALETALADIEVGWHTIINDYPECESTE